MAKKTSRSDNTGNIRASAAAPERRRSDRATTRSVATTPEAAVAEPDGSPAVALASANDRSRDAASAATRTPSYEEIAEAAYQRYLNRGGQDGHDFDDWLDAERSLRDR